MRGRPGSRATAGVQARAAIRSIYCGEPLLAFAGDRVHEDQKTGLARFGSASLGTSRHPTAIRLGFVGTGGTVEAARTWFRRSADGVAGDGSPSLPDFPGCAPDRGFFTALVDSDDLVELIRASDIDALASIRRVAPRFDAAVQQVSAAVKLLAQHDAPPDVVVLALPDELLGLIGKVRFMDPEQGLVFRNFRRALKAELMRYQVPTQIVLQRTTQAEPGDRNVDHASRVAWNLLTSLYFKAGGIPWRPVGLAPDTCYIGISFHRPLGSTDTTLRSSVAQAFDEYGIGLVLRGPDFTWDVARHGASPHLTAEHASALLDLVLQRYRKESKRLPARVVVHKTSRFWEAEREGFRAALVGVDQMDLVAVTLTSEVRLVRAGRYPPLRGTLFTVGTTDYLYTTGYIPVLDAYPHGHVPSPLQVADHVGDSSSRRLAEEILLLTKMNWNSASFAGSLPITVRFSRLVGDIMREVPADREPQPQFKFYT